MGTSLNIDEILSQVKNLNQGDQLTLIQRMAHLLQEMRVKNSTSLPLSSLSGLGSTIWKDQESIDNYIDGERQW
ncbi:MAG: hypothetical protein ABI378_00460 [Chitinophagaceae bacterium]